MLVFEDARITNILLKAQGKRFVDLGCGSGNNLDALASYFSESVGLDYSTKRRDMIPGDETSDWEFRKADLNRTLPIEDNWADAVLVNQVIEHILDPIYFAKEIHRILHKSGVCVVTTPNIRYIKNLFHLIVSGYGPSTGGVNTLDGAWDNGHIHYFTNRDLLDLFKNVGFNHIESRALVDLKHLSPFRKFLDRMSSVWPVREFLSGNILLVAYK